MSAGKFITFEGGEGAGKSTQVGLLAKNLSARGIQVVTTREPGGSPGAETIRGLLLDREADWDAPTEALLHFAARADHYTSLIAPALKRGDWVICDRFADSTRAYQGYGLGLDLAAIDMLYELTLGSFRPDLTIILDLPVGEAAKRLAARGGDADRYERMDTEFHARLRQGFLEIAAAEPERCLVLDAACDIETMSSRIISGLDSRLGTTVPQ